MNENCAVLRSITSLINRVALIDGYPFAEITTNAINKYINKWKSMFDCNEIDFITDAINSLGKNGEMEESYDVSFLKDHLNIKQKDELLDDLIKLSIMSSGINPFEFLNDKEAINKKSSFLKTINFHLQSTQVDIEYYFNLYTNPDPIGLIAKNEGVSDNDLEDLLFEALDSDNNDEPDSEIEYRTVSAIILNEEIRYKKLYKYITASANIKPGESVYVDGVIQYDEFNFIKLNLENVQIDFSKSTSDSGDLIGFITSPNAHAIFAISDELMKQNNALNHEIMHYVIFLKEYDFDNILALIENNKDLTIDFENDNFHGTNRIIVSSKKYHADKQQIFIYSEEDSDFGKVDRIACANIEIIQAIANIFDDYNNINAHDLPNEPKEKINLHEDIIYESEESNLANLANKEIFEMILNMNHWEINGEKTLMIHNIDFRNHISTLFANNKSIKNPRLQIVHEGQKPRLGFYWNDKSLFTGEQVDAIADSLRAEIYKYKEMEKYHHQTLSLSGKKIFSFSGEYDFSKITFEQIDNLKEDIKILENIIINWLPNIKGII